MKPMVMIDGVLHFQPDPKAEQIKTARSKHAADVEAVKDKLTDAAQREILLRILARLEALET